MSEELDEFTPLERGLLIGDLVARSVACGKVAVLVEGEVMPPGEALRHLADEEPPEPDPRRDAIMAAVHETVLDEGGMAERLAASEDPDAAAAFWAGFRHGVRAYLVMADPSNN